MKINKWFVFFVLSFLLVPVFTFAQSIKYVAYFPSPNVFHQKINAKKLYARNLAGLDSGGWTVSAINAEKDLDISAKIAPYIKEVQSGFTSKIKGEGTYYDYGMNFNTTVDVSQLNANSLSFTNLLWVGPGSNKYGFQSSQTGWPNTTSYKFCWSSLRIKGTYEYRYYLIFVAEGDTCP